MADNVAITAGSGTTIAADDVSGVKYQRVKVTFGTDGTATDASSSNPLPVTVDNASPLGQTTMSGSVSVTMASNQTSIPAINGGNEYETVAASQTAQVIGTTGAAGDYISHILVVPATTSPGNVLLLDNATSITVFAGGASSVSSLIPFAIPLQMKSASGAWKITTGSNVSCIAVGDFP